LLFGHFPNKRLSIKPKPKAAEFFSVAFDNGFTYRFLMTNLFAPNINPITGMTPVASRIFTNRKKSRARWEGRSSSAWVER